MAYFSPTMAAKRARRPGLATATAERVMVRPYGGCPGATSLLVLAERRSTWIENHRKWLLEFHPLRCSAILPRRLDEFRHGLYGRFRPHVELVSGHEHHRLPAVNGDLLRLACARATHDLGE